MFDKNISVKELHLTLENGLPEGTKLFDVREEYEFQDGHIEGSQNLPLSQISQNIGLLKNSKELLLVCRSGARSGMLAMQLQNNGINAKNVEGGLISWAANGYELI